MSCSKSLTKYYSLVQSTWECSAVAGIFPFIPEASYHLVVCTGCHQRFGQIYRWHCPCFVTVVEEFFDITNGLSILICTILRLSTCGRSGMLVKCRKWVRFVLRTISITVGMTSDYVQTLKWIARLCFYFAFLFYNLNFNLLWSITLMSSF